MYVCWKLEGVTAKKKKKTSLTMFWFIVDSCEKHLHNSNGLLCIYLPHSSPNCMGALYTRRRVWLGLKLRMFLNYSVYSRMQALPNQVSFKAFRYSCASVYTNGPWLDWTSTQACLVVCKWTLLGMFPQWFAISGLNISPYRTVGSCLVYSYTFVGFYFFSGTFPQL